MLSSTLESVESTRMALCALSCEGDNRARAVHTLRITHFARAACPDAQPRVDLEEMIGLCEVARLEAGYWVPVPPTTVDLGGWTMLLAPHPSKELERVLGVQINCFGLARIYKGRMDLNWPRRTVAHWTRIPADTNIWTQAQLDCHRSELLSTRHEGGRVEFYRAAPRRRGQLPRRWLPLSKSADLPTPETLVLFREFDGSRVSRYFIGMQKDGQLTHETPLRCGLVRLQFGLEMLAGSRQSLSVTQDGTSLKIRLTRALPPEERVLFIALTSVQSSDAFTDIRIPIEVADLCFGHLELLGFEIQRRQ